MSEHKTIIVGLPTIRKLMARKDVELPSLGVTLIPDDVLFNNRRDTMILFGDDVLVAERVFRARKLLGGKMHTDSKVVRLQTEVVNGDSDQRSAAQTGLPLKELNIPRTKGNWEP
jgi:hypothetical protein